MLAPAAAGCDGDTGSIMGRSAVELGVGFGIVAFGHKLDLDLTARTKIPAPYETTHYTEDLADTSTISCLKQRELWLHFCAKVLLLVPEKRNPGHTPEM